MTARKLKPVEANDGSYAGLVLAAFDALETKQESMTDHQPMPVAGYTMQSQSNVDLANELKQAEERYLRLLDKIDGLNKATATAVYDGRCIALARTKMQEANMWAVRGIFQPQRIKLPEDAP